uniref:Arginyl-tRNA--protein transferase n=1 Tax=Kalanchoe fedtschenkoi TaxID=63787 RepID=A0A7N0TT19_KALFE
MNISNIWLLPLVNTVSIVDLLDRGWRRSGSFLYKPEMESTCCPSYTIRLNAMNFRPSKEQLRVSRRMQRFLDGKMDEKKSSGPLHEPTTIQGSSSFMSNEPKSAIEPLDCKYEGENEEDKILFDLSEGIDQAISACSNCGTLPQDIHLPKASVKKVPLIKRKLYVEGCEELVYTSNVSFQIAAAIQRARSTVERAGEGNSAASDEFSPNQIAEKLSSSLVGVLKDSGLSIRACNGHINMYAAKKSTNLNGVNLNLPHYEDTSNCEQKRAPLKVVTAESHQKRRLEIRLKRTSFDAEEYALYRKYQIKVHNDTPEHVTANSYKSFLVETPLVPVQPTVDGTVPPCGFGSFHQQYVIDGHLVAVGVIDILPKCLSSKYLFWDPDFAFLSLGKYSALQEINWVKENQAHCSSLQYYYLGYYIHSCSKMRYKARYYPSELLCPLRYQWVPFKIAKPHLDKKPYVVLSDIRTIENGDAAQPSDFDYDGELQHDAFVQEDSNDVFVDGGDHKMEEADSGSSDDELAPETNELIEVGDVSDILIGLKDSRVRFKELRGAFGVDERQYMECQLKRFKRVVGDEVAERMVYSMG